jgi:hypothetical protein
MRWTINIIRTIKDKLYKKDKLLYSFGFWKLSYHILNKDMMEFNDYLIIINETIIIIIIILLTNQLM